MPTESMSFDKGVRTKAYEEVKKQWDHIKLLLAPKIISLSSYWQTNNTLISE